jgi:hypothetical protein
LCAALTKYEKQFADFLLDTVRRTLYIQTGRQDHRWLLHQMTSYYHMDTESLTIGSNQSVKVTKSAYAQEPKMKLSDAIRLLHKVNASIKANEYAAASVASSGGANKDSKQQQQQQQARKNNENDFIIHFLELSECTPVIKSADLLMALRHYDGHFVLTFLNSGYALASFEDSGVMRDALSKLLKTSKFVLDVAQEDGAMCLFPASLHPSASKKSAAAAASSSADAWDAAASGGSKASAVPDAWDNDDDGDDDNADGKSWRQNKNAGKIGGGAWKRVESKPGSYKPPALRAKNRVSSSSSLSSSSDDGWTTSTSSAPAAAATTATPSSTPAAAAAAAASTAPVYSNPYATLARGASEFDDEDEED